MSPESVAALPLETRLDLRARFERAMREQAEHEHLPTDAPTLELVTAFDAPRRELGDDAIVLLLAERGDAAVDDGVELHTIAPLDDDAGVALVPYVDFVIDDPTLEPYAAAIDGDARPWLERVANDRGVRVVEAAPGAPVAIVGDDEHILVSPSWLALLSSIDGGGTTMVTAPLMYDRLDHHSTTSSHFGCYESCDCSWGFCGAPSGCTCNYCGFDWGLCASECGPEGEGCHCHAARRPTPSGSFLDPIFAVLPLAYLALRRRRR